MGETSKVAMIGTGGTISAVGRDEFDVVDYDADGKMLQASELLGLLPRTPPGIDVFAVPFRTLASTGIYFPEWRELVRTCDELVAEHPELAGIVIAHGTASLEETAYFLHLTLKIRVPVVVVGSQRPSNVVSSDGGMNLYNAIRVAASPKARGLGVLVVLNDEIQAARDVTKTSTHRMQAFRSPDLGVLGHCDGDAIEFYRLPVRIGAPNGEFEIRTLDALPSVGVSYSYAGAEGSVIDALVAAGARGIVSAGFAPGCCTPSETEALGRAAKSGVVIVQSTRAGSGRVAAGVELRARGFVSADNLNPQKARILLALALTKTNRPEEVERIFRTY